MALIGVAWVALAGTTAIQVAVAVALVWWMLSGGLRAALTLDRGDGSDAYWLARRTLIRASSGTGSGSGADGCCCTGDTLDG